MGCSLCFKKGGDEDAGNPSEEVYITPSPKNKTDGNVNTVKNIKMHEIKQGKENSPEKIYKTSFVQNDFIANNIIVEVEKSRGTRMQDNLLPETNERRHITFKGTNEKKDQFVPAAIEASKEPQIKVENNNVQETHGQDKFVTEKNEIKPDNLTQRTNEIEHITFEKTIEIEQRKEDILSSSNTLIRGEVLPIKIIKSETMLPIWCEENKQIVLKARGKWSTENIAEVDSKGLPDRIMPNGFPLFSLICRVGGEVNYFLVSEETSFTPGTSGPLFYFINSPNINLKSEASLELEILNASPLSLEAILKKMNIPSGVESDNLVQSNMSEIEIEHFNLLNHLRSSPSNFADLYLHQHYTSNGAKQEHIYTLLRSMQPMRPLNISNDLQKMSDCLADSLGKSGRFSHENSNETTAEHKMKTGNGPKIEQNICINKENLALEFVIKMLLDDMTVDKRNRKNILNEELISIGISVKPHKKFKWVCVYNFTS